VALQRLFHVRSRIVNVMEKEGSGKESCAVVVAGIYAGYCIGIIV